MEQKTVIHKIQELDLVPFHMKDNLSDGTSKINLRTIMSKLKKLGGGGDFTHVVPPVNVGGGTPRGPA